MITALLVEDENFIRNSLLKQMPWKDMGIDRILDAQNGETALSILESERIDIMITDIRMEDISGMDLCQFISENHYCTKSIIITGFGKIEYAKASFKYGVSDFVLKPIDPDELQAAIVKCVDSIQLEREKQREIEILKDNYSKSREVLIQDYLSHIAAAQIVDEVEVNQYVLDYSLDWSAFYCVTLAHKKEIKIGNSKLNKLRDAVNFCEKTKIKFFTKEEQLYILCEDKKDEKIIFLQNEISNMFGTLTHIGFSRLFYEIVDIPKACFEAQIAANIAMVTNTQQIEFDERMASSNDNFENIQNSVRPVINAVFAGEREEVVKRFDQLWGIIITLDNKVTLKMECVDILILLYQFFDSCDLSFRKIVTQSMAIKKVIEIDTWGGLYNLFINILNAATDDCKKIHNGNNGMVINKIKEYIQNNIHQTITLDDLAREVYLSPKYLSALVKKETGITITELINTIRVDKAKELLADMRYKTYTVAEMVGITDARYFGQMFKKITGITPSMYRKLL